MTSDIVTRFLDGASPSVFSGSDPNEGIYERNSVSLDVIGTLLNTYVSVACLVADDASSGANTNLRKITGLDLSTGTGTYQFRYMIRYQSVYDPSIGSKFAVDHSGSVGWFIANHYWASSSALASSLDADQDNAGGTPGLFGTQAVRAVGVVAGPTTSSDTADSDMLWVIDGTFACSAAGNIELWHGPEIAAVAIVKAGSSLVLTKVGL